MSSRCQGTREIQQRLSVSGFALDSLTKELDRLIRAPASHARDARLRECRYVAGIECQDAVVAGSRRTSVFLEQSEVAQDRKSTRLNSSHRCISYAVFCLKKKMRPSVFTTRSIPRTVAVETPLVDIWL